MRCLALLLISGLTITGAAPFWDGIVNGINSVTTAIVGEETKYAEAPYTILQNFEGYEEREYPGVKWACTKMTYNPTSQNEQTGWLPFSGWRQRPSSKMFMKLFRYITGGNADNKKIPMTVPVLSKRTPHQNGDLTNEMCFYIDPENQSNPPAPSDPLVTIVESPKRTVFAHRFSGYIMKDELWTEAAEKFSAKLADDGREVEMNSYFSAQYDGPMTFWNRRNDVMFLKKIQ